MGLENILIEGNVKVVVDVVHSSNMYLSLFGDYNLACKSILRDKPHYCLYFAKRCDNAWTHEFTRASHFYENSFY